MPRLQASHLGTFDARCALSCSSFPVFGQFCTRASLIEHVEKAQQRVTQEHTWARVSHHRPDMVSLLLAVAMNLAKVTDRLRLFKRAVSETLQSIGEQIIAVIAQALIRCVVVATIETHHGRNRRSLACNTGPRYFARRLRSPTDLFRIAHPTILITEASSREVDHPPAMRRRSSIQRAVVYPKE